MDIRYSTGKEPFKRMDTEELRKEFLIQGIFKADDVSAVYSHVDRIVTLGCMGDTSGTGVAFTRDPSTGENRFYGEFLMNAQGEDVVAGIRTPKSIDTLKAINPKVYDELAAIRQKLEKHYHDMVAGLGYRYLADGVRDDFSMSSIGSIWMFAHSSVQI